MGGSKNVLCKSCSIHKISLVEVSNESYLVLLEELGPRSSHVFWVVVDELLDGLHNRHQVLVEVLDVPEEHFEQNEQFFRAFQLDFLEHRVNHMAELELVLPKVQTDQLEFRLAQTELLSQLTKNHECLGPHLFLKQPKVSLMNLNGIQCLLRHFGR